MAKTLKSCIILNLRKAGSIRSYFIKLYCDLMYDFINVYGFSIECMLSSHFCTIFTTVSMIP
jgi:hypothetical protein